MILIIRYKSGIVLLAASVLLGVAGCGGAGDPSAGLRVVVTTSILGDVASEIVGSDGEVEVLVPSGADPHLFAPSSQQVASMSGADLVIANGLGLEAEFEEVLEGLPAAGATLLEVAPALDPIPFGFEASLDEADEEEEHPEDHDHGLDPHVWMDPLRMGEAARVIAAALARIDPGVDWAARAEEYADEMAATHAEIEEILSPLGADERVLVTNHEALGYFADRYDFEIVGTIVPGGSTLGDPSSEELARLIEVIRAEGVKAIFAETTQSAELAEAVAAEAGVEVAVVELHTESLGEPGSGADTLAGMLITDARLIADALGSGG